MNKPKKRTRQGRPKGSHPVPNGNYVVTRGSIIGIHRNPPDVKKLARAFFAQAEQLDDKEEE